MVTCSSHVLNSKGISEPLMAWFWMEVSRVNWGAPAASWFPGAKRGAMQNVLVMGSEVLAVCKAPLTVLGSCFRCCALVSAWPEVLQLLNEAFIPCKSNSTVFSQCATALGARLAPAPP